MGSVTVSYPFDTVRRRLMMMSGEGEKMYRYVTTFTGTVHHVHLQVWYTVYRCGTTCTSTIHRVRVRYTVYTYRYGTPCKVRYNMYTYRNGTPCTGTIHRVHVRYNVYKYDTPCTGTVQRVHIQYVYIYSTCTVGSVLPVQVRYNVCIGTVQSVQLRYSVYRYGLTFSGTLQRLHKICMN